MPLTEPRLSAKEVDSPEAQAKLKHVHPPLRGPVRSPSTPFEGPRRPEHG